MNYVSIIITAEVCFGFMFLQIKDEGWMDNGVSSKFREELLKILEKPYDEREFEDLWQRISHRSHVNRDINLRSGCIRFETKAIGKSYLDHHAGDFIISIVFQFTNACHLNFELLLLSLLLSFSQYLCMAMIDIPFL
jgi:hypothetical protein